MRALQYALAFLPFAACSQLSTAAKLDEKHCGKVAYNPDWYTCYNTTSGSALCPIESGSRFKICGRDCYTPLRYHCNNVSLSQLPVYNGPVVLKAVNPTADFDGKYIQALGQQLWIGGETAPYCPEFVINCPRFNTTVIEGSSLSVLVPGGQQLYIKTDGSVAFTQAHSIWMPDLLPAAGYALSNAGYWGMNGSDWVACRTTAKELYKIYSGAYYHGGGGECKSLFIKAENQISGTYGAWQYS